MIKNILNRYLKSEDGVAAVEFAMLAPPLIFMLLGVIDYGSYLNRTMLLENTAYAAAQYIRAGGTEDDLEADLLLDGNLGLTEDNVDTVTITVTYEYECDEAEAAEEDDICEVGDYLREFVSVTVEETFDPILPYPGMPTMDLAGSVRLQNN